MPQAISFPFRFDSSGRVAVETSPARIIRQDVLALVNTLPGERVMLPGYGASLLPYVFDNIIPAEQADIQQRINNGMLTYVPDAAVLDLEVFVGPENGVELGTTAVNLSYIRRSSLAGQQREDISFTVGRPQ